jgi:hypothetical protein
MLNLELKEFVNACACRAKEGNFAEGKVIRGKAADGSGRIEDSDFATSADFARVGRRRGNSRAAVA